MVHKVTVAKGVKVRRGTESKMRKRKGSSSAGKYKDVKPKDFSGKAGGASAYSFPIPDLAHARNALARAHFAPNPEGIRAKVYRMYPELKKRHEERDPAPKKKKDPKGNTKAKRTKAKGKIEKVMHEYKEGTLHSGSKKGPQVKNRKKAIAIALSESRKAGK